MYLSMNIHSFKPYLSCPLCLLTSSPNRYEWIDGRPGLKSSGCDLPAMTMTQSTQQSLTSIWSKFWSIYPNLCPNCDLGSFLCFFPKHRWTRPRPTQMLSNCAVAEIPFLLLALELRRLLYEHYGNSFMSRIPQSIAPCHCWTWCTEHSLTHIQLHMNTPGCMSFLSSSTCPVG